MGGSEAGMRLRETWGPEYEGEGQVEGKITNVGGHSEAS